MSEKKKVLVIDDEKLNFDLVARSLSADFDLVYMESGTKALEYLETSHVSTILLDVNMPELNGYEVCRRIRSTPNTKDIPVIFVSGLETMEERLAGYEAGADDYIVKPFPVDELKKKVEVSVANEEKLERLKKQSANSTEAVMSVITASGELGVVLNFFTTSFTLKSFDELVEQIFSALGQYGLKSSVQIRPDAGVTLDYDCSGVVKPLGVSLITNLKENKRIFDFNSRTLFNFPYISILIKNMPLDDPEKYGRHKDNLALLVEGANARIQSLLVTNSLRQLIESTRLALGEIQSNNELHRLETTRIFDDLIERVEESILTADLSEEQENRLLGLVTGASERMNQLYDQSEATNKRFVEVTMQIWKKTKELE